MKALNILKKIFNPIYIFLDKVIVTPISVLIFRLNKRINRSAGLFDGLLNKQHSLILLSLLMAILIFLFVDSKAVNLVETESEILANQPVKIIYNKEKYVVEGVPKKVDVILIGRKSDLYLAKQLDDHEIVLDLSDYKTGEYNVKLKYNHSVESVTYKLDPSTVNVKISEKVSSVKTLTYDLLNQDKLDSKLNVSEVKLAQSEVYVKGSKEVLKKVATVKALIDVSSLDISESGIYDKDSIPMVAYDEEGNTLDNVEIVPEYAKATIKVDSYFVDLPVRVIPQGTFATGTAIASATPSVASVRVYGDQNAINNLSYVAAKIDVDGLNANKTFNVNLTKPTGVRYMSESTTTVDVKVADEMSKELNGISIQTRNLGSDFVASTVNVADTSCTVIVKGSNDVLNQINNETVSAFVDLSGLGVGVHDVPVEVEGENPIASYISKTKTIQIKIANKG